MPTEIDYERLFVDALTTARLDLARRANDEAKLAVVQAKPKNKHSLPINLTDKTHQRTNLVGQK